MDNLNNTRFVSGISLHSAHPLDDGSFQRWATFFDTVGSTCLTDLLTDCVLEDIVGPLGVPDLYQAVLG